jgi:predicted RNA binding protein YcfA (HicA-like mRNA interferase family)
LIEDDTAIDNALGGDVLRDSRDIVQRLRQEGYELISVSGSHHKFVHRPLRRRVIVPHPKRDLPAGTVRAIYRDAGWEKD